MLTNDTIAQFYKNVESLRLKYPVAEIHRKTGYSKGQISQVLSKKLSPSEELINEFNKSFNIVSDKKESNKNENYKLSTAGVNITLQDYIDLLHRENDRLFTILNSALGRISDDTHTALAYQKAWVKYEAERASKGNKDKEVEIRYKMSKLVDDELQSDELSGSHDGNDS